MPAAQLHISGITFTWNNNRLIFNKVSSVSIVTSEGDLESLENDQLYRVVTGLYCAQMLSAVKAKSYGLLSIVPKYADGTEITDFDDCILYDQDGNEIKEWYALASYIMSFDNGEIPDTYSNDVSTTRKIQMDSWNPVALLKGINGITIAVICIVLALILLLAVIIRAIVRKILGIKRFGAAQGSYTAQNKNFRIFHPGKYRSCSSGCEVSSYSRPRWFGKGRYGKGYQPAQPKKPRIERVSKRKYGKFAPSAILNGSSGRED